MNQNVAGVFFIPLCFLVVTLVITLVKGESERGSCPWLKRTPLLIRFKTWSIGAFALVGSALCLAYAEEIGQFANMIANHIPSILVPLTECAVMLGSVVGGFLVVLTIFFCIYACTDETYSLYD
ncbi:MAG TPA: hypothetical protein VFT82_01740 [Candidatus Paceibacterota bacterium]|nr:hypothetical protein [Candidatus Paceibacterota bacterium]